LFSEGPKAFTTSVYLSLCKHLKKTHKKSRWMLKYTPSSIPDHDRVYYIEPSNVNYLIWWPDLRECFNGNIPKKTIKGGDWDLRKVSFEETYRYKSLMKRFEHGANWEDTEYYRYLEKNDKTSNPVDVLTDYDDLFEDMRENGFNDKYPVKINIGRGGELIRHNGLHRLTIARILDIDQVPTRVNLRHREWQKARDTVARAKSIEDLPNSIDSHLLNHPDLIDIKPD